MKRGSNQFPYRTCLLLLFLALPYSCATSGQQGINSSQRATTKESATGYVSVDSTNVESRLEYFYLEVDQPRAYRDLINLISGQLNPPTKYVAWVYGFLGTYFSNSPRDFLYYLESRSRFKSTRWVEIIDELVKGETKALANEIKDLSYPQSPMTLMWASYTSDANPATLRVIFDWYSRLVFPSDDTRFYAREVRYYADRHPAFKLMVQNSDSPFFRWSLETEVDRLTEESAGLDRWYRLERFLDGGDSAP